MSDLITVDAFDLAKEFQWEIDQIEDPIDAALEANKALDTLNRITDERLEAGTHIIVHAFGAYVLKQWDEDAQKHVTLQYDPLWVDGETAGIGFVQNLAGALKLQTLFFAVRDSKIVENVLGEDDEYKRVSSQVVPRLMIPVLQLESVEKAA